MPWDIANLSQWVHAASLVLLSIMGGWLASFLFLRMTRGVARLTDSALDDTAAKLCAAPLRVLGPILGLSMAVPLLGLPQTLRNFLSQVLGLSMIGCLAWLGVRMTHLAEEWILKKYDISMRDNLKARSIQTQVRIMKRIALVVILLLAFSSGLMTFEKVRQLGTGILASAGIAGIVLGLAAQRTISTLLAGLQIAVTQPFRIDDVLVVENEWGRVEEITLTYVVLRLWDQRRLVLPITFFLEKPFQNWTRVSAELIGSVFLHVDYSVPIQALREELRRVVAGSRLWDGRVCVLQVTDSNDRTLELRALVSAEDSSKAWDLRCMVREKLMAFLREHSPECLPRVRVALDMVKRPQESSNSPDQAKRSL